MKLQLLFDKLDVYSTECGFKVNTWKTKICIFENRKTRSNQVWSYNGEIVDSFCYLDVTDWFQNKKNEEKLH